MTFPLLQPPVEEEQQVDFCGTCGFTTLEGVEDLTRLPLWDKIMCRCGKKHVTHLYLCSACHQMSVQGNLAGLTRRVVTPSGDKPSRKRLATYVIKAVRSANLAAAQAGRN